MGSPPPQTFAANGDGLVEDHSRGHCPQQNSHGHMLNPSATSFVSPQQCHLSPVQNRRDFSDRPSHNLDKNPLDFDYHANKDTNKFKNRGSDVNVIK